MIGEPLRRGGDLASAYDARMATVGQKKKEFSSLDSDHTDVKYRRKPFGEWFSRFIRYFIKNEVAKGYLEKLNNMHVDKKSKIVNTEVKSRKKCLMMQ